RSISTALILRLFTVFGSSASFANTQSNPTAPVPPAPVPPVVVPPTVTPPVEVPILPRVEEAEVIEELILERIDAPDVVLEAVDVEDAVLAMVDAEVPAVDEAMLVEVLPLVVVSETVLALVTEDALD